MLFCTESEIVESQGNKSRRQYFNSLEDMKKCPWDKNGCLDFSVNCPNAELKIKDMRELREMVVMAIGVMEDMWRREQERNQQKDRLYPQAVFRRPC